MAKDRRDFRPAFVGAAINKLLSRIGGKASDSDLASRWPDIAGDGSEVVKVSRGVRGRTIWIRAKNPAERLTLSYRAPDILKRVNDYFGYDAAARIVVK